MVASSTVQDAPDFHEPVASVTPVKAKAAPQQRPLRPGDVVEVRSPAEILATLDSDGAIDNMPFMPEMQQYIGKRFTVSRRVDKICDTIAATGSRRMRDTVYLEDLRCDGSGHDGCQAGCRIYWKESWLRRIDDAAGDQPGVAASDAQAAAELDRTSRAGTRPLRGDTAGSVDYWRCQATEALKATDHLKTSNLRQYWREARNGNYKLSRFLFLLARGFFIEIGRRTNVIKPLPLHGPGNQTGPAGLDLQAGELVRVRDPKDIEATLDETGHNRRLSFDREMLPYCGRTMRVKQRVEKIIDDKTGRMMKLPKDCLVLEGAVCSGERTAGSHFCPRAIYPFWREAWVERVQEPDRTA
jgi:hypothetical protein